MSAVNSFGAKDTLKVGSTEYEVFRVDRVPGAAKLPFSLKVLEENLQAERQLRSARNPIDPEHFVLGRTDLQSVFRTKAVYRGHCCLPLTHSILVARQMTRQQGK